ncbi:lysine transporter LysE [Niveispirillum sp. SYP-B3756]|uniref:LysE family translocator n=1 Tax=Niveispirillum sp. SYP-B3756 TaxID=2662178 RepID=UPI0012914624|nr:LysE family transporter [Niveispirillum sp. SYP-B3756]MQP65672.1 lysine transporter LysE [Niveispirillum sp. SYP-B3756]
MLEEMGILWRGVVLGLIIAAPVGPTGLLCIRRSLERGLATGFATGIGAAIADAGFSAIAAFGITAVLDIITGNMLALQIVGGLFLLGVAIHSFLRDPKPLTAVPVAGNLPASVATGLLFTVTNPVTILGIGTIVVGFGHTRGPAQDATLVAGIFLGSLLWWAILCGGVTLLRRRVTGNTVHWINIGTGILLAGLGLYTLGSVVRALI